MSRESKPVHDSPTTPYVLGFTIFAVVVFAVFLCWPVSLMLRRFIVEAILAAGLISIGILEWRSRRNLRRSNGKSKSIRSTRIPAVDYKRASGRGRPGT